MRRYLLFAVFFAYLLTAESAWGDVICPPTWRVERTGTSSCWASVRLSKESRLCVPERLWVSRLRTSDPLLPCGDWPGRWKLFSPLRNSSGDPPKKVMTEFVASGFPIASATLANRVQRGIEQSRESISSTIAAEDRLGILRSLVVGERHPGGSAELIRMLGFVHVLTGTGIHLFCLSLWVFWLFRIGAEAFAIPVKLGLHAAGIASALVWAFAWTLCGLRPGMLRPLVILGLRAAATFLGFRWRLFSPLILSLLLNLALSTAAALSRTASWAESLSLGSWTYGLAVGGGLLGAELAQRSSGRHLFRIVREHAYLAVGSWMGVALGELLSVQTICFATPLLTLITLPLMTIGFYPAVLLTAFFSWMDYSEVLDQILRTLAGLQSLAIEACLQLPLRLPLFWFMPRSAFLIGLGLAVLVLLFTKKRVRLVTVSILFALIFGMRVFWFFRESPRPLQVERVEQLDVGQGDAALVSWSSGVRRFAGLIDTGSEHALSPAAWIHLLSERGISELRFVVLSHLDEDHSGGVLGLARGVKIGCLATSEEELETDRGQRDQQRWKALGLTAKNWDSGCFPFDVARPDHAFTGTRNENMSAFWVPLRSGWNYLAMGDAKIAQELAFLPWIEAHQGIDPSAPLVFKASHHGSASSSSDGFIARIHPALTWISVGVGNRYRHPSLQALWRFEGRGVPVERTDRRGFLDSDAAIKAAGDRRRR